MYAKTPRNTMTGGAVCDCAGEQILACTLFNKLNDQRQYKNLPVLPVFPGAAAAPPWSGPALDAQQYLAL